ncbi:MAG: tyrosine-type recombinase/integrase [Bacillota bacterium]
MLERTNEAKWIANRKRWQINVQRNGQRKTFTAAEAGTQGKIICERKADRWLEQGGDCRNPKVETVWKDFLQYLLPNESGRSENGSGYANYAGIKSMGKNYILPNIGKKRLGDLTQADWQTCVNRAYQKGLAKKTLRDIRSTVTQFYNYSVDKGIWMRPMRKLKIQDDAPVGKKRILQPQDLKRLFKEDTVMIYGREEECFFIHAFRFFVITGLRRGELCGLEQSDLSGENREILHIKRSVNNFDIITEGKNNNARRWIVLPELALWELREQGKMLKKYGISTKYIFPDEKGGLLSPKHLYSKWQTYRKQHNILCSIHELRHTMISLNKNSVPPELLKQVVGHSASMDTFGIYGHEVEGEKHLAKELINETLQGYLK